jgi:hypothetical protein
MVKPQKDRFYISCFDSIFIPGFFKKKTKSTVKNVLRHASQTKIPNPVFGPEFVLNQSFEIIKEILIIIFQKKLLVIS